MEAKKAIGTRIICPICENNECEDIVIDLMICNACSHIFKKVPIKHNSDSIHLQPNPVEETRKVIGITEYLENDLTFVFPSMMFYSLELHPTQFYRSEYNHYFNQMSLLIFLKRCGLKIVKQENVWEGNICKSIVDAKHEE